MTYQEWFLSVGGDVWPSSAFKAGVKEGKSQILNDLHQNIIDKSKEHGIELS